MPGISAGALLAHPPILLPDVGGEQSRLVSGTVAAIRDLDARLAESLAELVLFTSPHSPAGMTSVLVRRSTRVSGSLARFRAPEICLQADVDVETARALVRDASEAGFPLSWTDEDELDHGVVVPLSLLERTRAGKSFVFLGIAGWPLKQFVAFGTWLHQYFASRSTIFVASGDLSHRLLPGAPAGFSPQGRLFDELVIDALRTNRWERVEGLDPDLIEEAGECGLRPLAMLLGAGRAAGLSSAVLHYEGPFGVGYPVVHFSRSSGAEELARRAIAHYLRHREIIEPPATVSVLLRAPSGVFVTLRQNGEVRGCVGSTRPVMPSAAHEIIRSAISAAIRDPRFEPVTRDELPRLVIHAQLLDQPEPVAGPADLDPAHYGLIVRCEDRQALLLPGLDGIDTAEQQIAATCLKAGIDPRGPLALFRFRVRAIP